MRQWPLRLMSNNIRIGFGPDDKCEDMFRNANLNLNDQSLSYAKQKLEFDRTLAKYVHLDPVMEGHIGNLKEQGLFYWILGNISVVRTVCEIGFNAGHSALIWLESNPLIHLHSFDINTHKYTQHMANYLKGKYPGRFDIYFGMSDDTIPVVSKQQKLVCDIIIVDGGHYGDQPLKDIISMRRFAHKGSLLLIDDTAHGADFSEPVLKAINHLVDRHYIKLGFMCSYKALTRGFSVFNYII